jgi:RHS repeat-associated protein
MCDGAGETAWSYNEVGDALIVKRTTNSVTDAITYTFNLDSSVATVLYPSGRKITYQPGGAQLPLWGEDVTNSINYATSAHYAPPGGLGSLAKGSSIYFTEIYNNRLQPCWQYATTGTALPWSSTYCNTADTTAGNVLDLKYGFNSGSSDNGNVMGIANNIDNTRSQTFTYDSLNRIATAAASTYANSPAHCWGETYTIDRYANLTGIGPISSAYTGCVKTENLSISVSTTTNRITITGITYDLAGNMTSNGTISPHYDAENRICSVGGTSCTTGTTYSYDGDGKRVMKSSGTLYWYGTSSSPLLETNGSGNLTNEYIFFGGMRIARRDSSGNVFYYFSDDLGTSREIVQAGQSTPCYDTEFYPYGGERVYTNTCSQNYLFTGKERDSESGLDNFGARYYSSQFGRWMSVDPAYESEILELPQSWNRYSYVYNRPTFGTDPDGRCPPCVGAVLGGLIEGGYSLGSQLVHNGYNLKAVNWTTVGANTVSGAITGAIAGSTGGASLVLAGSELVGEATFGAGLNAVGGEITRELSGQDTTPGDVATDLVTGFLGGAVAHSVASLVRIPEGEFGPRPRGRKSAAAYDAALNARNQAGARAVVLSTLGGSAGTHGAEYLSQQVQLDGQIVWRWVTSNPSYTANPNPMPNGTVKVTQTICWDDENSDSPSQTCETMTF